MIEYKYRPPFTHLIAGVFYSLSGIGITVLLTSKPWNKEWPVLLFVTLLMIFMAIIGICFLVIYFSHLPSERLFLSQEFLEVPGRWQENPKIYLKDIIHVDEFNTYDHVIDISTKDDYVIIERQWMKNRDFFDLRKKLINYLDAEIVCE